MLNSVRECLFSHRSQTHLARAAGLVISPRCTAWQRSESKLQGESAGARIPASLRRLVEFLNEQVPRVEVLALEIRQYQAGHGGPSAVAPRLVGQTARPQAGKEPAAPTARRPAPWTTTEVLDCLTPAGPEAAAVGDAGHSWAVTHPRIRITGGTGTSDRSFTMSADTGCGTSPDLGVLSLYATPGGGRRFLEIRIRATLATPPYDRSPARAPDGRPARASYPASARTERPDHRT